MTTQSFSPLDDQSATALLREAHIQRQSQSGGLDNRQMDEIRSGKQDQSIGFDDAKFALTNVDSLWDKAQQSMGVKERVET